MPILSWIGALVVLLVGALTLNGVGQTLEGRDSVFIHFGWVTLILLVGGALFPFWGWTSTGWVLGVGGMEHRAAPCGPAPGRRCALRSPLPWRPARHRRRRGQCQV